MKEGTATSSERFGLIADDLTGAADAALAFWEHGIPAVIQLAPSGAIAETDGPLVIAIDVDSRHLPPAEAAACVVGAVNWLRESGVVRFYKKIDSTLRGNLGAEVEAALHASLASLALVCPAFPALGRTVRGGRVRVHGVELAASAAGRDPRNPMTTSRVAEALARQTALPVVELPLPPAAPARMSASASGRRIAVLDAVTDDDLLEWVRLFGLDEQVLWAGSAGLAGAISRLLAEQQPRRASDLRSVGASGGRTLPGERPPSGHPAVGPALVVAGSVHPGCREQVGALLALSGVASVVVSPADIAAGRIPCDEVVGDILQALHAGRHVVVYTDASAAALDTMEQTLRDANRDMEWAGERIAAWLGAAVAAVAARAGPPCADLVLTGGDTARAVLSALGIDSMRVVGAVAPGVPIGAAPGRPLRLVTKAGGFGERDMLVRAVRALVGGDQP